MRKIILGVLVLVIVLGGYTVYQLQKDDNQGGNEYYQKLAEECQQKDSRNCCMASLNRMKEAGAYRIAFDEACDYGYQKGTLKCKDSFTWCEPMTTNEPTITPDLGFDSEGNGPICTQEAKSCGDGTYVGRTGPNCEFAPCPGEKPTPDFTPTPDNPIQLPANVISEKDCVAQGGEVWNTLGETSYDGELIGRVEGLKCPCACLVK